MISFPRQKSKNICTKQKQTEFTEPMVRINTDVLDHDDLEWDEATAWDEVAAFYQQQFAQQTSVV